MLSRHMHPIRKAFLFLAFAAGAGLALLSVVAADAPAALPALHAQPASVAAPAGYVLSVAQASVESSLELPLDEMPEPGRWLLVLSGVAAALWVARRRLGYTR